MIVVKLNDALFFESLLFTAKLVMPFRVTRRTSMGAY
jgi:hypothetical protein